MKNLLSLAALAAFVSLFGLTGCEEKSTAEKVGDKVEDAADEVGDAVEDAGDKVKDAADGR